MDFLWAFLVGGAICVVGQLLIDLTKLTPARILVSFVVLGVVLEGCGLYQYLVDFAGCGATVPLTGFGYTLAMGTRDMIDSTGWLGILTGPLSSGAAGISAAVISGIIISFITRSGTK
ncbi:MAG: stage V sporulation protein AE [Clostridia bacterium]|nr:stage V sporulation protein AE [Clostridia bacterium]